MVTFKQFISEAAVGAPPTYKKVDTDNILKYLQDNCSNSMWMLHKNRPFYRGDNQASEEVNANGISEVNTELTTRKSKGIANWYTEILDHHPDRQNFPKRSKSLICTTDVRYAANYADNSAKGIYAVIPFNDAKIGLVNKHDMWQTKIGGIPGHWAVSIDRVNDLFTALAQDANLPVSFKSVETLDKIIKKDPVLLNDLKLWISTGNTGDAMEFAENFLNIILKGYSAEGTGHTCVNTSNMPKTYKGELWVGGKVAVISQKMWGQLLELVKK